MEHKSLARALAMLFFISSAVSAFCIGALVYTLLTGDLPFCPQPYFHGGSGNKVEKKREVKEKGPGTSERIEEEYLKVFYKELKAEKEKLAEREKKLDIRQKVVEEIKVEALKMQKEIQKKETEVRNLLVEIDKKELDNIKKMAALISGLEPAPGALMLMEYNNDMAARVLYFMNPKKASDIIAQLLTEKKNMKRLGIITEKMQTITEKLGGENSQ